jgi:hypothetical protein
MYCVCHTTESCRQSSEQGLWRQGSGGLFEWEHEPLNSFDSAARAIYVEFLRSLSSTVLVRA